jgi:predicted nucleic acid-binding protein
LKVFIDTGAFLALTDEDDRYHTAAKSTYAELLQSQAQLLTSNFVLSETYTLVRFRVSHRAATQFMNFFDETGIRVLHVGRSIEQTGKAIFARHNDKDFSFVDCTSFALIDHFKLDHAFAFDRHFRQYRFKRTVVVLPIDQARDSKFT